jgi:hypothetical protein
MVLPISGQILDGIRGPQEDIASIFMNLCTYSTATLPLSTYAEIALIVDIVSFLKKKEVRLHLTGPIDLSNDRSNKKKT